jgi:hypothetical protein
MKTQQADLELLISKELLQGTLSAPPKLISTADLVKALLVDRDFHI